MGNARPPLSEELHDLVRDVVEDLESAAVACDPGRPTPRASPTTAAERRRARQATILRLRPDVEASSPPPPPATTPPAAPPAPVPLSPPPPPIQPHRQRAYLARLDVASSVFTPRLPVRTRRLAVACRRVSPLDAGRAMRMLRIAVPTVVVDPRAAIASPPRPPAAWATLISPARFEPRPDEPATAAPPAPEAEIPAPPVQLPAPAADVAGPAPEAAGAILTDDATFSIDGVAAVVEMPDPGSDVAALEVHPAPLPDDRPAATPLFADLRAAVSPEARAATLPAVATPRSRIRTSVADAPSPWRGRLGHATNLLIAVALEIVVMVCATMVGLIVTGHHLEEVVTGSMQPTIPIGSIVLTERIPTDQLTVGDVVVFPDPDNTSLTIVHRIVWLSHDQSGDVLVRTKGDYNALPDSWTLKRPATSDADRVFYIIPGGGTVAGYLQTLGFWGLIVLLVGVIGYYGIRKVRQILGEDVAGDDAGAAPEPT